MDLKHESQENIKEIILQKHVVINDNRVSHNNEATSNFKSFASHKSAIIKEVGFRWVIVASFFLLSFSNGMQWVTFSAIADNFKKVLNISSEVVDIYSLSYMYCFPIIFPFAAYIIDNKSVRGGVRLVIFNLSDYCSSIVKRIRFNS